MNILLNFIYMANITLESISKLLKLEFEPIKKILEEHTKILAQHTRTLDIHTKALDTLLTKKKIKDEETVISAERFDRLEHWAFQVGKKLGIKLEL